MPKFLKRNKPSVGAGPDELIFRGAKKIDEVLLRVIDFDAQNLTENALETVREISTFKEKDTVTWLNIDGLHNTEIMQEIAASFDFDTMVLSEVMNTSARPRVIEYDNCAFISIKMLSYDSDSSRVMVENLSLILTESVLISFQERKGDVFEPVRERIRKQKKRIRNGGTDYLAFALLDIVVDNYLLVLSILGEKIDALEENLMDDPDEEVIHEINNYKRELNFLRRSIKPAKEMVFMISKLDTDYITEDTYLHFKELQDNISQASDNSDTYRDILSDQLNVCHTTLSSKLNDTMKFLTVFSVIFIPLTFIAGIYGTNFDYMPELNYKYSYFIMWIIMIVVAAGMLIIFKRKRWF